MTNWVRLRQLSGANFRSLIEPFRIDLPASGLVGIQGLVKETGGSSGSGKSSLVLAVSHLFGGCPYPATELQSWDSDAPPVVAGVLDTPGGQVVVERAKGLTVTLPGCEPVRGRAAEAVLDKVFGLDAALRAMVTYRGQDEAGLFLSRPDADKKEFLCRVLGLDRYERVAAAAYEAGKAMNLELQATSGKLAAAQVAFQNALAAHQAAEAMEVPVVPPEQEVAASEAAAASYDESADALSRESQRLREEATKAANELAANIADATKDVRERQQVSQLASPPAALPATKHDLEVIRDRLTKVKAHDAEQRSALDVQRGKLRTEIATSEMKAKRTTTLEAELEKHRHRLAHLNGGICPTCLREWVDASLHEEALVVIADIAAAETAITEAGAAAIAAEAGRSALAAIPDFAPHPFVAQLAGKELELQDQIRRLEAEHTATQRKDLARLLEEEASITKGLRQEAEQAARNKGAVITELEQRASTAKAAAKAHRQAAATATAAVAAAKTKAASVQAIRSERAAAFDAAQNAMAEATLAYAAKERAVHAEQDIHALVGRTGFLGVIFDDVLAEVSDAANAMLARVANVRHLTFGFEPGADSKRITPVVCVNGIARPFNSGLSGGMKSGVQLLVDLAVGEVVAKRRGSFPGWLVLDECFNGLGPVEQETCLEMLVAAAQDRMALVIQHAERLNAVFQQVIHVESVDGRSKIL